ncbi:LamG-like jellyroll fold domain-containing protein [candidate division KSB1 bacterium]
MKKLVLFVLIIYPAFFTINAQTPGNALNFDGSNDYVSSGLPVLFTNIAGNDFTIECWVKVTNTATQRVIFAQYSASIFVSIMLNTSNQIYAYVYNGSANGQNTSTALTNSQWTHIAVTWDASSSFIQVYINGIIQTLSSGGGSSTGSNNTMTIGSRTDGSQVFKGEIDDLRIWNHVRNTCQIQTGMHSDFTLAQTGLVAYYKYNQGTAGGTNTGITTLNDFTSTYNGTLQNFALSGSISNWVSSAAGITQSNQNGVYNYNYSDTICQGDTVYFGSQALYSTGLYADTLLTVLGCDSIVTLDLTVDTVDVSVLQLTAVTLQANASNATYQWLNCDNNFSPIIGDTNQSFTATSNGNFAVEVTQNGCVDTSLCISIVSVGIAENTPLSFVKLFPNPTAGKFTLRFDNTSESISVTILNIIGKTMSTKEYQNVKELTTEVSGAAGYYFVEIKTSKGEKAMLRILKE